MTMYMNSLDPTSNREDLSSILSHQFSNESIGAERVFIIPNRLGAGKIRRMKVKEGLEIIISDIELLKDATVHVQSDYNYFEMNYCLSGETTYEMEGQQFKIQKPTSHVYYSQETEAQLEIKADIRSHIVEIRLSPETLIRYFDNEADKKRIQKMLKKHRGEMVSYYFTPVIKKRIFEILQCSYRGPIKQLYIEAKVMELISLFLEAETFCLSHSNPSLNTEDIKKLRKAREIILNCLDTPYSIKELAKKVGLNDFKLKKGFRQLYGITIFGLIRSQRMEKAAWLMRVEGYNVSETASIIGYSNFSNFTLAFRKQFGCNPSDYLKQINIQKY